MSERDDLTAAICQHPDDDVNRLVFADWLEEHGEAERAEHMRLQIQQAKLSKDDPEFVDLENRIDGLWDANRERWLSDLPTWDGVRLTRKFQRGFIESVTITPDALTQYGDVLWQMFPIRELDFQGLTHERCAAVADLPVLSKLRQISFFNNRIGDEGLRPFLESPHFRNLKSLRLTSIELTNVSMSRISISPHLKNLEALVVSGNAIYDDGIAELASAEGWNSLRRFEGYSLGLSHRAAFDFASAPVFAQLENLQISENWLRDIGVFHLMQSPHAKWKILDLGQNDFGDDGAMAIAGSRCMQNVRELELRSNHIGADGMRALCQSPYLQDVEDLSMWDGNRFGDEGTLSLAQSPYLTKLRRLDINGADFGEAGARALFASPNLTDITFLGVSDSHFGLDGVRAFVESPYLTHLESLSMNDCDIGDEGCVLLMYSSTIRNLTDLWFDNNDLTDIGAQAILDSPYLTRLSGDLTLDDDAISDAMVLKLRERFGNVLFLYRPDLDGEE